MLTSLVSIGPSGLTSGTVSDGQRVPTVLDNAFEQGAITAEAIGISFEPAVNGSAANGLLTFGGSDSSRYVGDVNTMTITGTSPASNYVGIEQAIRYADNTTILSHTAGIVDTGTTLILLATDAFDAYKNATGAVTDETTGLLKITKDQYDQLRCLYFTINGVSTPSTRQNRSSRISTDGFSS